MAAITKITPDEIDRFRSLYQQGYSVTDIAAWTNRSYAAVAYMLKRHEPTFRNQRTPLPQREINRIVALYNKGHPIYTIGRMTNHGTVRIRRILAEQGIDLPPIIPRKKQP